MAYFAKTFFTNTDRFYDAESDTLLPCFFEKLGEVSETRRARVERVRSNISKAELLVAELLRDYALKEVFGIDKPDIIIGENGKPHLSSESEKFFNISHSGRMVICTVSNTDCGVDIENTASRCDLMNIAGRFFSVPEQNAIMMSPDPKVAFCRLWTIRESYVKMRGTGFSIGLKALRCDFHRGKAAIFENEVMQDDAFFNEIKNIHGYRACVCTRYEAEHEINEVQLA